MASLLNITNRIKSVESTLKITSAMKLVATAKLRVALRNYEQGLPYANTIDEIIKMISMSLESKFYTDVRESGQDLYIIISSEIGLCGGYNSNMIKLVEDYDDAYFITLGSKATTFFKSRSNYKVIKSAIGVTSNPSRVQISEIGDLVFRMYNNFEIRSINLVYTQYVNSVTYKPVIKQVLPLEKFETKTTIDYEPSIEVIFNSGLPRYIDAMIYTAMKESLVSEYASRRVAMENATDNANELLSELQVKKNRARQAAITQEISEIVSGADAL